MSVGTGADPRPATGPPAPGGGGDPPAARPLAAALVGVLAVAAAASAGHLVAGILLEPAASPYLAVAGGVVDRTPEAVKRFAIQSFGESDKLVLLLAVAAVVAVLAAAIGNLSRRRVLPGLIGVALLGAVGVLAVLQRPAVGRLAVLAPLAALAAGLLVFGWLHGRVLGTGGGRERSATGRLHPAAPLARRGFLVGSAGVAGAAAVAGVAGQLLGTRVDAAASRAAIGRITPRTPAPPIPAGADFVADGTPPFLTPNSAFYRVDVALRVPALEARGWRLSVTGLVDRPLTLDYNDILDSPDLVEKTITMTCVSNEVGGSYVSTSNFIGIPLRNVLERAGVGRGATQLVGRSSDGMTIGTPVDVVLEWDRDALLAIGMNGEPLPPEHGFPARTVVPGLYGYVSGTKWVTELELTTFDFEPYWRRRDWAAKAPIKTQSRIDSPKPFQTLPAGRITFAGVAWAQHVGVDDVQVRLDRGDWQSTELSTEVSVDTWRMWRTQLDLGPGSYLLEVRARDRTGFKQTPERVAPIPDGAEGWHSLLFSVQ